MGPKLIGGPLDGAFAKSNCSEGIIIPIGEGRFACYFRVPWDECVFQYDGDYHYHKTVDGDMIEFVNRSAT